MDYETASKMTQEAQTEIAKINSLLRQLLGRENGLKGQLEQLEKGFPQELTRFYLGEITSQELSETRQKIEEIRRELAEIPAVVPVLQERQKAASDNARLARHFLGMYERRRIYFKIRDGIIERGEATDNELADMQLKASHAGCPNEYEALVRALAAHRLRKKHDPQAAFSFETQEGL